MAFHAGQDTECTLAAVLKASALDSGVIDLLKDGLWELAVVAFSLLFFV